MMARVTTCRVAAFIFAVLSVLCAKAGTNAIELFTRAIQNNSTAPNYVLITVINDRTKEARLLCTEAPFLLGAIHIERQISYDDAGCRRVKDLALGNTNRTFHFARNDALKNLACAYDDAVLTEMRSVLKPLPNEEIRKGFRCDGEGLDKLYVRKRARDYNAYRDAIAHILLERGLLPRRGCVGGCLTVDE
jgi:hypothetical protein